MKFFFLVNKGLEEVAQQEITELIKVKSEIKEEVLTFSASEQDSSILLNHSQTVKRLLVAIIKTKDINSCKLENLPLLDRFSSKKTFLVEVEGIKGQENRLEIARSLTKKIFDKLGFEMKIDFKQPDIKVFVYYNQDEYFIGIDLCGGELNKREYRLFPHQASFKGDLSYFFLRKSGYQKKDKLLVAYLRDGVLAIEAALFANNLPLRDINTSLLEIKKETESQKANRFIYAFDPSLQNINASRKNAKLAGVNEFIKLNKYSLEDVDLKNSENEFERIIMYVTKKDEDKINEIYYQMNYILKKKGTLLLIGRTSWDLSVSERFSLVESSEVFRGNSGLKYWLLEKK